MWVSKHESSRRPVPTSFRGTTGMEGRVDNLVVGNSKTV
jgi:hypothetical protein